MNGHGRNDSTIPFKIEKSRQNSLPNLIQKRIFPSTQKHCIIFRGGILRLFVVVLFCLFVCLLSQKQTLFTFYHSANVLNSSRIPGSVLNPAVNIAMVQGSVVKWGTQIVGKYSLCKKGVGQRREQGWEKWHMIANNRRVVKE